MLRRVLLPGTRFGRLTVEGEAQPRREAKRVRYRYQCVCECGRRPVVTQSSLVTGGTRSCGCLKRKHPVLSPEQIVARRAASREKLARLCAERATKHGGSGLPEHHIWASMRRRCREEPRYGGRGIYVCEGWSDFAAFLADMGRRPSPRHSIDRRNNDASYTCGHCQDCVARGAPANCWWATPKQQSRNRSVTVYLTHNGERLPLREWAERLDIPAHRIAYRLKLGWSVERALTAPDQTRRRTIVAFGRAQTLTDWSKETGIPVTVIWRRLRVGLDPEMALTASLRKGKPWRPYTRKRRDAAVAVQP